MKIFISVFLTLLLGAAILPLAFGQQKTQPKSAVLAATSDANRQPSAATPQTEDVRLVESTDSYAVVEFRPSWQTPTAVTGDAAFTDYRFRHATASSKNIGLPAALSRNFTLTVPSSQSPVVTVLAGDYEQLTNVKLAPLPTEDKSGNVFYKSAKTYGQTRFGSVAKLAGIAIARGRAIATINLNPLQYDASQQLVRKYSRLLVRITFATAGQKSGGLLANGRVLPNQSKDEFAPRTLNATVANAWPLQAALSGMKVQTTPIQSVLAQGKFFKLEVKEEGVYKLDKVYLQQLGLNVSTIDPRKIKIYGNGGQELPQANSAPRPADLIENAIYVQGESDGVFGDSDYILFYGKSPRGFWSDTTAREFSHLNRFTTSNYYFLTADGAVGKRITANAPVTASQPYTPQTFYNTVFTENDRVNVGGSGMLWVDTPISPSRLSLTYQNALPNLDPSGTIRYRFRYVGKTESYVGLKLTPNGNDNFSYITTVSPTSDLSPYLSFAESFTVPASVVSNQTSQLTIALQSPGSATQVWMDWVAITYPSTFAAISNQLKFYSPSEAFASPVVQYNLTGFSSNTTVLVWDVTDPQNIKQFPVTQTGGSVSVNAAETPSVKHEYMAFSQGITYKKPTSAAAIANQNLHGISTNPEYIIVTTSDFKTDAERLRAYRESQGLRTLLMDVEQIYNEFSGGMQDYTAIRDFVRYFYSNAATPDLRPKYLLLFGDGDYDYRNLLSGLSSPYKKVPMYETEESFGEPSTFTSDDYFVGVDGDDLLPDLAVGRMTVQTASEARLVTDKVQSYETSSYQGDWRNRSSFVADDDKNGSNVETDGASFMIDCDDAVAGQPTFVNPKKIYSSSYKAESVAGGIRRPTCYQAIIDQINQGTLVMNWLGHGNPQVWAAEHLLEPATSIPQMINADRLAFVVTATCDFGRWDDPTAQSGGELFLLRDGGGAVGLYTTTRSIYTNDARDATISTSRALFTRDAATSQPQSVGMVLYQLKVAGQVGSGTDANIINLIGDPALRLNVASGNARIDAVNGQSANATPFQLKALGKVVIDGSALKPDSTVNTSFNGKAVLTVFDSEKNIFVPEIPDGGFTYSVQSSVIYHGTSDVRNGRFTANFVVPKDINYNNGKGKFSLYLYEAGTSGKSATGYNNNFTVGGTDTTAVADTKGPVMDLYLNSTDFVSGGLTNENPLLIAHLADESGINLTGSVGHNITLIVDENTANPILLNDLYQSLPNSYQSGQVQYQLQNLSNGKHTLRLKAWDSYNNSSEKSLDFIVSSSQSLALNRIYNYPNPFKGKTAFIFEHNRVGDDLAVKVKIYTVAGRLVKTLEQRISSAPNLIRFEWDGKDEDGSALANGIYIYKVVVKSQTTSYQSEMLQKLAIVK